MKGFAKGDRVVQEQYGAGTLTAVNEYHTVIDFDEHGEHRFITSMVMLERTNTPAPERPGPVKGGRRARRVPAGA
jgi:hypothetical protein